jgi:ankyrin repeat protein
MNHKEIIKEEKFFKAIRKNRYNRVSKYLNKGFSPNDGMIHANTIKMIDLLISSGADISNHDFLRWACQFGQIDKAKYLIDKGADVDFVLKKGNLKTAPIHMAAYHGKIELVKLLIDHGADVNIEDASGANPIFEALTSREETKKEIIELLINKGGEFPYEFDKDFIVLSKINHNYRFPSEEGLYEWFTAKIREIT